jgi:hypothetical protein
LNGFVDSTSSSLAFIFCEVHFSQLLETIVVNMRTIIQFLALAAAIVATPTPQGLGTANPSRKSPGPAGPYPQTMAEQMANGTSKGATNNGFTGVILEPDLVLGKPVTPGSKNALYKYGPFTIKAGAIVDKPVLKPDRPCSDCYVTAIQAGLEYPDGSKANVDTGAWLHHMVLSVAGKMDPVCKLPIQRIFASGNERCPVRVNGVKKYGIDIGTGSFSITSELMNMGTESITVYLTMLYEFIPKTTANYKGTCSKILEHCGSCHQILIITSYYPCLDGHYWLRYIGCQC